MSRQTKKIRRLEDALCTAICIIRNEAGTRLMNGQKQTGETLNRWCDELIDESRMKFDSVLKRTRD